MYKVIQFEKLAASPEEAGAQNQITIADPFYWELKVVGANASRIYSIGFDLYNHMVWFPISAAEHLRLSKSLLEQNNDEIHYNDNKT